MKLLKASLFLVLPFVFALFFLCPQLKNTVSAKGDFRAYVKGAVPSSPNSLALVPQLSDGSPDSSFGGTGIVTTSITNGWDRANSVKIQADGKIIVGGSSSVGSTFAIVRYTSSGTLDSSFGNSGIIQTSFANSSSADLNALALQTDGKILAGGTRFNGTKGVFTIVRYNVNGSLDTSFGEAGIVTTDVQPGASGGASVTGIEVQPNGKITVVGTSVSFQNHDIAILRYTPDGTLDDTFNGNGKVIFSFTSSSDDYGNAISIEPDAKILIGGATYDPQGDFALAKLRSLSTCGTG